MYDVNVYDRRIFVDETLVVIYRRLGEDNVTTTSLLWTAMCRTQTGKDVVAWHRVVPAE